MNQVERILKSNAPIQEVGGTKYKGQPPRYRILENGFAMKEVRGIPFVRVR